VTKSSSDSFLRIQSSNRSLCTPWVPHHADTSSSCILISFNHLVFHLWPDLTKPTIEHYLVPWILFSRLESQCYHNLKCKGCFCRSVRNWVSSDRITLVKQDYEESHSFQACLSFPSRHFTLTHPIIFVVPKLTYFLFLRCFSRNLKSWQIIINIHSKIQIFQNKNFQYYTEFPKFFEKTFKFERLQEIEEIWFPPLPGFLPCRLLQRFHTNIFY